MKTNTKSNSKIISCRSNEKFDECYTPEYALTPLLPYLTNKQRVWECASGTGLLASHLKKHRFEVICGNDFLNEEFDCDVIVTNPPYSLKYEFLKRAYDLKKPFAFLMPITTLEGIKRGKLFKEFGLQLIIPNRRINFIIPSGKKSAWVQTAWFTSGLNLTKDLTFVDMVRDDKGVYDGKFISGQVKLF